MFFTQQLSICQVIKIVQMKPGSVSWTGFSLVLKECSNIFCISVLITQSYRGEIDIAPYRSNFRSYSNITKGISQNFGSVPLNMAGCELHLVGGKSMYHFCGWVVLESVKNCGEKIPDQSSKDSQIDLEQRTVFLHQVNLYGGKFNNTVVKMNVILVFATRGNQS